MFALHIEQFVDGNEILPLGELTFPHPRHFDGVNWDELGEPGQLARRADQ
jgi:hypothetical protein